MSPARLVTRILVVALLVAPAAAHAEDADALIKQGVELRRAGKDEAALEQFRRAYDLAPTPRALAQMGLAEQALGRWVDGEAHLTKALDAAQDPWITKFRDTLEGSRAEIAKHLGSLSVTGGPEGTELRVDGQPVGTLPLRRTLRLPAGSYALELSERGQVIVTRIASVASGATTHEDLSVSPATGMPASTAHEQAQSAPHEATGAPSSTQRNAAWVAAGGAVVLAAAGGISLYLGNRNADEHNQTCRGVSNEHCNGLLTEGTHEQQVGTAGLILAGASGATAAILFLTARPSSEGGRRVACLPDLGHPGATCALRF